MHLLSGAVKLSCNVQMVTEIREIDTSAHVLYVTLSGFSPYLQQRTATSVGLPMGAGAPGCWSPWPLVPMGGGPQD